MSFRDGSQADLLRFDELEGYTFRMDRSRLKSRTVSGPLYEPFDTRSYSTSSPALEPWLRVGPRPTFTDNRARDMCYVFCPADLFDFQGGSPPCISSFSNCSGSQSYGQSYGTFLSSGSCSLTSFGDAPESLSVAEHQICLTEYIEALLLDDPSVNINSQYIVFGSCGFLAAVRPCPTTSRLVLANDGNAYLRITTDEEALSRFCPNTQFESDFDPAAEPCSGGAGGVSYVDVGGLDTAGPPV